MSEKYITICVWKMISYLVYMLVSPKLIYNCIVINLWKVPNCQPSKGLICSDCVQLEMLGEPLNSFGKGWWKKHKGMVEISLKISFILAALYCTLHTAPKNEHAPVPAHFILETEHSTQSTPDVYTACCTFTTSHSKHPRFAWVALKIYTARYTSI